ncbi:MAG: peptide deformylase [Candidatus Omnitrophica bacterium]|nr:peptide deformylase [Candidatus Omnitrophota bacterium]MDD5574895.1 peptide deformylase [Candidatus Omnitrophota bacterium]
MEPFEICKYPDNILRKRCARVERITGVETRLFEMMLFTMRYFGGIGLAAPQIGIARNLIVADIGEGPVRLADPVILHVKGSDKMKEGCLSIPGVGVVIDRPDEIVVNGLDERGKAVEFNARGLLARVLQHEIDHLKGKLIIDTLSLFEKIKLRWHARRRIVPYAYL